MRAPRGRISLRKFIMSLATFLVVVFGYVFIAAPTAHAADASWDGQTIAYEGNTYEGPNTVQPDDGLNLPPDTQYYLYTSGSGSTRKAHVIYFAPGADPPSETRATYATYDLAGGTFSNKANVTSITLTPPSTDTDSDSEGIGTTGCAVDGVGWIVCGVSRFLAGAMDYLYGILAEFLEVQPLQTTGDGPIYRIWDVARNFANLLFVIGFLFLIYAHLSGGLLTNYTIKKMLPRIIIAAILVNVSYWICAIGVDVSNILGYAVQDMFIAVRESTIQAEDFGLSWVNMTEFIITGGTAALSAGVLGGAALVATGGSIVSAIFLLFPFLVGVIIAALIAVIVLAMRQALITILIIAAPLAFVAYMLPNTEKWFERWRGTFMTMLMLFPIFSAIFGGSQLAGMAIMQAANGSITLVILGMAVQVAPLVITPLIVKFSGNFLARIAQMMNNPNKGLVDRTRNWSRPRAELHRDKNLARPNTGINRFGAGRVARRMKRGEITRAKRQETYQKQIENAAHSFEPRRASTNRIPGVNRIPGIGDLPLESQRNLERRQGRTYGAWDERYRDAELDHRRIDAHHKEHWAAGTQVAGSARRQAYMEAHESEGRSKLYEEAVTNAAERGLQTQINATPNLRNLKIQADVDASHAQFQAANVAAEGKQTFQNEILANRALRMMNVQTVAFEKEASVIESTLKQRAEASWERITSDASDPQFDNRLRNLRLQEVEASDSQKKAEAQWNKLVENIRAKGAAAPDITLAGDKTIAGNIKQLGQDIVVEQWAAEAAKRISQSNMSQELKTNDSLRTYAGGIGGVAASNRIYAKATKEIVGEWLEERENSRTLLSEYTQKQLVRLHRDGIDRNGNDVSDNEALIDASMQVLAMEKGNNWALQKLRDNVVREHGMLQEEGKNGVIHYYELEKDANGELVYDSQGKVKRGAEITDQTVISRNRDVQQLLADAIRKSPLKVASISQTDISELDSGVGTTSGKQAIIRDILQGKFDQTKIASLDVDELQRMVMVLRDQSVRDQITAANPEALQRLLENIDGAQINDNIRGMIKDRERGVMFALAAYLDPAEQARFNDPNDHPEKYHYSEKLPNGAIVRRHRGDANASRHEAPVIASQDYLVNEFLNSKGRGPNGNL